ncbi:MAG: Flp pilus assembly protein CpaB [Acidimicrobiales bacterium]
MLVPLSSARRSARARLRGMAERPALWWSVAGLLALTTAGLVLAAYAQADAARRQWGDTRAVVVATVPLSAGQVIEAGAVERQELPVGLVPDDALIEVPVGRTATAPIVAGEVLVAARVAPSGVHGPAALVPPGWRAVAVPVGLGSPALVVGDRVDVLATFLTEASESPPTFPVAEEALVVDTGDDAITVAVPAEEVARLAFALTSGTVTLALRGPDEH